MLPVQAEAGDEQTARPQDPGQRGGHGALGAGREEREDVAGGDDEVEAGARGGRVEVGQVRLHPGQPGALRRATASMEASRSTPTPS